MFLIVALLIYMKERMILYQT